MSNSIEKSLIIKVGYFMFAAAAATSSVLIYFYENYRIPLTALQVKSDNTEATRRAEEKYTLLEKEQDKTMTSLMTYKEDLERIKTSQNETTLALQNKDAKIYQLQLGNLFYPNSLYPVGLGNIRIRDNIDSIKDVYSSGDMTWKDNGEDDPTVKLSKAHSVFTSIEYSYDRKSHQVISIFYQTDYRIDQNLLRNKLLDSLGPAIFSKGKEYLKWQNSQNVSSYLMSSHQYTVMVDKFTPILWQDRAINNTDHPK